MANALKELGVGKGTKVAIYMGMVPELPVAMLACTRLGAPHTVVFGGFSADSLSDRANDMGCEVLVTQDEAWRRGTTVPLKQHRRRGDGRRAGDRKVPRRPPHRQRGADAGGPRPLAARARRLGRPGDVPARADGQPRTCSSSCTRPARRRSRGIAITTGGYLVGVASTHALIFDLKPEEDVYWCAADIGWITGHSYIVYGPLTNGATSVLYEGTPDFPDKDRWWEIVERYGSRSSTRPDGDPRAHEVGHRARGEARSPRCGCSAPSASRSTRRRGSGTASTSAATGRPSSTRGGRPRPG